MAQTRRGTFGFTIVELMITMTVLAILGGMVTWGSNTFNRSARLRGATRDVLSLLNYARNQAMVKRRIYRVRIGRAGATMDLAFVNGVTVPQGAVFIREGETSSASTAFPTAVNNQMESLVRAMDQTYKDIEISRVYRQGNANPAGNTVEEIFFKPDGQSLSCTGTGPATVCTTSVFFLCIRGVASYGSGDLNTIPKLLQVQANGSVSVPFNPANAAAVTAASVPQCN